jgi:hypothetical protein
MLHTKFRFIWPKGFRGEEFKKYLFTDRDGMSNLYRGPSIDASYQVSDH